MFERKLAISSKLANIDLVRTFLDEVFLQSGLDRRFFNKVFLGLSEAFNNSIVHGNRLDPDKFVFLRVFIGDNATITIEVKDQGEGFSANDIEDPTCKENLKKENGRGIFLLQKMADEVVYCEGGTKVLIKFTLTE